MKSTSSLLAIAVLALSLTFTAPAQARRLGTQIEGTVQTVDSKTKHVTIVTKDGMSISFRWTETTKFVNAAALTKGATVQVDYHDPAFGEAYVNSVVVLGGKK